MKFIISAKTFFSLIGIGVVLMLIFGVLKGINLFGDFGISLLTHFGISYSVANTIVVLIVMTPLIILRIRYLIKKHKNKIATKTAQKQ